MSNMHESVLIVAEIILNLKKITLRLFLPYNLQITLRQDSL